MGTAEGYNSKNETPYLSTLDVKKLPLEIDRMFRQLLAFSETLNSDEDYEQKYAPVLAVFLDLKLGESPAFKSITPETLESIRKLNLSMAGSNPGFYQLYTACQGAVMSYFSLSGKMANLMDYDEQHFSDQFAAIAGGHITTDHLRIAEVSAAQVEEMATQTHRRIYPGGVSPEISDAA